MRRFQPAKAARPNLRVAAAMLALIAAGMSFGPGRPAAAQDNPAPAPAPAPAAKAPAEAPKKRHNAKKPAEAPPPAAAEAAADEATKPDPLVVQLDKAGVKTCLPTLTALGKNTLPGVAGYARAANWQTKTPNERLASVILGQSYPEGAPLPKAFAMLLGAPAGKTKCDGYSIQVIPTTDKCSALQTKILIRGKKVGELSGIPLLNDLNGAQVMLLPTAGDGCVLVGVRIEYAE